MYGSSLVSNDKRQTYKGIYYTVYDVDDMGILKKKFSRIVSQGRTSQSGNMFSP